LPWIPCCGFLAVDSLLVLLLFLACSLVSLVVDSLSWFLAVDSLLVLLLFLACSLVSLVVDSLPWIPCCGFLACSLVLLL
jgi:uncharacterized membrane protein